MVKVPLFEVDPRGFEPHTYQKGAGYGKVKNELCEVIEKNVGITEIEEGRTSMVSRSW